MKHIHESISSKTKKWWTELAENEDKKSCGSQLKSIEFRPLDELFADGNKKIEVQQNTKNDMLVSALNDAFDQTQNNCLYDLLQTCSNAEEKFSLVEAAFVFRFSNTKKGDNNESSYISMIHKTSTFFSDQPSYAFIFNPKDILNRLNKFFPEIGCSSEKLPKHSKSRDFLQEITTLFKRDQVYVKLMYVKMVEEKSKQDKTTKTASASAGETSESLEKQISNLKKKNNMQNSEERTFFKSQLLQQQKNEDNENKKDQNNWDDIVETKAKEGGCCIS